MTRDRETDRQLYGMGWMVLRFWGKEIQKYLPDCVEEIKETIFQMKIARYDSIESFS